LKNLSLRETASDIAENLGLNVTRTTSGWHYRYRYKHPQNSQFAELTLFTKNGKALV
jgi:hypothetical protein